MGEVLTRRVDVSTATFFRLLGVAALVWALMQLWQWILIFIVAVFIAVALEPTVMWLEARGVSRRVGAPVVVLTLTLILGAFLYLSEATLQHQFGLLGERLTAAHDWFQEKTPPWLKDMLPAALGGNAGNTESKEGGLSPGSMILALGQELVNGMLAVVVALVLTLYLLLDGRRTYLWFVAFAPPGKRPRVHRTAHEARKAIVAYVNGNVATSVICTIVTYVALVILKVPAAFLLALLAGVLDFIPVVGFILSIVPAVLLALTVSPFVALLVILVYLAYNAVENYYISPKVYGYQMQLSSLAVLFAFMAGAEIGGVLGALVALPFAAMYPTIESLWLERRLGPAVEDHRRIEQMPEH